MSNQLIDLERLMQVAKLTGALTADGLPSPVTKEASLSLSTVPSLAGCCGLFTPGGDTNLMTLVLQDEPFLSWLGWTPNNECDQFVKMITYVGASGTAAGNRSTPYVAACDDGNSVEFGTCEILLPDKGRMKRVTPTRDLTTNNLIKYQGYPVFAKDGTQIRDERAWAVLLAGLALQDDIKTAVISSNPSQANQFAGLESIVTKGYKNVRDGQLCSAMDSILLNWNSQLSSYAVGGKWTLIDYIIDIVRRIKTRAMWSKLGGISVGDMILVCPTYIATTILDHFTCWTVCPGSAYNETNLNTYEARMFRNSLNGGTYGMGFITVDGTPLPILTYDWLPSTYSNGSMVSDIYILTRQIGTTPLMYGQYIDMRQPVAAYQEDLGPHYKATDDGRFLTYWKTDNECVQGTVVFRPNIYCRAPWAQARIMNVAGERPLEPLLPDPTSDYYPEQYLRVAGYCPEDYLVPGLPGISSR